MVNRSTIYFSDSVNGWKAQHATRSIYRNLLIALLIAFASFAVLFGNSFVRAGAPPNFLIILADDLGFSDLGCYGSEIETPHLDSLAANGLRYTQFYNTARCWPSRAALLTGYYAQQINRDKLPQRDGGGQGKRPAWAALLPRHLEPLGYRSYLSGKWHVDGEPNDEGFARSYVLNDHDRFHNPLNHFQDSRKLPSVPAKSGYYATTHIATHAMECIAQHAEQSPGSPFFQLIAFTAPHFPLQAPEADIAKYRGRYSQGWDSVREERWKRLVQMKLVSCDLSESEPAIGPPYDNPKDIRALGLGEVNKELAWNQLTPLQQEFQASKMEVHAAMVDRMDQEIGRVLQQLRELKLFDNTLILFLSDNGTSAEIMIRGDGHDPQSPPGSAESFLCLGPGWSKVGNTPFRRHKTWVHEGGISTPMIAHWPKGIVERGQLRHQPSHVIDIAPTLLDLAGGSWPTTLQGLKVPQMAGVNIAGTFSGHEAISRDSLWWLHEGNRALRQGDWKAVAAKGQLWELYDLANDRSESFDLAAKYPLRLKEMVSEWERLTTEMATPK